MIDTKREQSSSFSNIGVMTKLYNYLKTIPLLSELTFGIISDATPAIAMVCGLCEKGDFNVVGDHYVSANFYIIYKDEGLNVASSIEIMNKMLNIIELLETTTTFPEMDKNQDAIHFEVTKAPDSVEKGENYKLYSMELKFLYYQY